jgi:hypothetical protein
MKNVLNFVTTTVILLSFFCCVSIWNDFSTINDIVNNHSQITKKMQRKDCESVLCSYS